MRNHNTFYRMDVRKEYHWLALLVMISCRTASQNSLQ